MMDWNDLRVVRAVERARSLSGAARALSVHQTTVGRRLRAAEEALGVPLFLRSSSGVTPTPGGSRLFAALDALGAAVEALERQASELCRGERHLVRLAVTENTARLLVPTALRALREEHPEISVELVPGNVPVDLARGEADLAVRVVATDDPDLVRRKLGDVRYGLYASPEYASRRGLSSHRRRARLDPLAAAEAEEFAGHETLVPSRELGPGPEAGWLGARAARATPVLFASSLVSLADAAAAGLGLTVLPDNLARLHSSLVKLRALPEIPVRPVWLVLHRDLRQVPHVRQVASAVAAALRRALSSDT